MILKALPISDALPWNGARFWALRQLWAAALLLALTGSSVTALQAADLVASNAVLEIRNLNRTSYGAGIPSKREENFAAFRRLLNELSGSNSTLRGNAPEEVILLRVARNLGTNSVRFDELLETYGSPDQLALRMRVVLPRSLHAPHDTEAYRPAWEALLLSPANEQIRFMNLRATITEALARIGNPESVAVLAFAFTLACEQGANAVHGSVAANRQCEILSALGHFPTEESLRAILRSLRQTEALGAKPSPTLGGQSPREVVARFLTNQQGAKMDSWRLVLSSFPRDNLAPSERELLDSVMRQ